MPAANLRPALGLVVLLALPACRAPGEPEPGVRAGVLHFQILGGRSLEDGGFWSPLEDQFAAGFDVSTAPDSALGLTFGAAWAGASASSASGVDPVTGSIELFLGPRVRVPLGDTPLRLYGGLGPSMAYAIVDRDPGSAFFASVRASDWGLGAYGQLGILYRLSPRASLGLEYRTLQLAAMDFFGEDTDLDHHQLAVVVALDF